MSRKKPILLILVIAVAGAYIATRRPAVAPASPSSASALLAPALTLTDLDGQRVETASYSGQVVLVNFWAAWCTPCTEEVPRLMELQEEYRARGLRVIGFSMEDREPALRAFYRQHKMNYPVVVGNEKIAEAYGGVLGLPMSILIGRDGRVRARYPGLADVGKLERDIVAQLRQP